MVTTDIHLACSVSNMTRLLWSVHVHMVSALYSYGFFLQVDALRTVSTRQNKECLAERIDNGTPAVLSARAYLLDVIFGDYPATGNSSCRLTVCRLFFLPWGILDNYLANGYLSVITCTMQWRSQAQKIGGSN